MAASTDHSDPPEHLDSTNQETGNAINAYVKLLLDITLIHALPSTTLLLMLPLVLFNCRYILENAAKISYSASLLSNLIIYSQTVSFDFLHYPLSTIIKVILLHPLETIAHYQTPNLFSSLT